MARGYSKAWKYSEQLFYSIYFVCFLLQTVVGLQINLNFIYLKYLIAYKHHQLPETCRYWFSMDWYKQKLAFRLTPKDVCY